MPKKILIIDGSDFRNYLINILSKYNKSTGIEYDVIPNQEIPEDKIKTFIKEVNNESYAMVFCHLRWISEKIATLDRLKDSDWFQPIFQINNRIGVSNGSTFRKRARDLQLFKHNYSHKEAADHLEEKLNEYANKTKNNCNNLLDSIVAETLSKDYLKKIVIPSILQIFMHIDIDMQALTDERTTDKRKYLKEMLGDVEDGFFQNKFNEAKKLIVDIPEGDNQNELKGFLCMDEGKDSSYICKFLELLEDKKKTCASLTEKDVEAVISYFSNKECKTFHDWYWELSTKGNQ